MTSGMLLELNRISMLSLNLLCSLVSVVNWFHGRKLNCPVRIKLILTDHSWFSMRDSSDISEKHRVSRLGGRLAADDKVGGFCSVGTGAVDGARNEALNAAAADRSAASRSRPLAGVAPNRTGTFVSVRQHRHTHTQTYSVQSDTWSSTFLQQRRKSCNGIASVLFFWDSPPSTDLVGFSGEESLHRLECAHDVSFE